MTDRAEEKAVERLQDAFAGEVIAAERELDRRPFTAPRRTAGGRAAVVALAIVLAVTGGVAYASLGLMTTSDPAPTPRGGLLAGSATPATSGGTTPTSPASPSDPPTDQPVASTQPTEVPIPTSLLGYPVLTAREALQHLEAGDQPADIVVGGRLAHSMVDCGVPPCADVWSLSEWSLSEQGLSRVYLFVRFMGEAEPPAGQAAILQLGGPPCAKPCIEPVDVQRVLWDTAPLDASLPSEIAGESVRTASQAIALAETDATAPFLVGGWYRVVVHACAPPPPGTPPPTSPLTPYCPAVEVLAEDPLSATSPMFPGAPVTFLEAERPVPNRPAVLRVHAHDPLAAQCATADRARCERTLVVEDVVWSSEAHSPSQTSIPTRVLGLDVLTVAEARARIDAGDQRTELIVGGLLDRFIEVCAAPPCQEVWTLDDPAAAQLAITLRFPSAVAAPAPGLVIVRFGGPSCRAPCGPPFDVLQVLWDATPLDAQVPGEVGGQPVLSTSQAIARAETDATASFLVGGWYRVVGLSCAAPPPGTPPPTSPLTTGCGFEELLPHAPTDSTPLFPGAPIRFLEALRPPVGSGPVVLRVHAHDPRAAQCAAVERAGCERLLVVEGVVWSREALSPSLTQFPKSVLGFPVITVSEAQTRIAAGDQAAIMNVGGWLLRGAADCAAPPCPGLWTLYEQTLDGPKLAVRFAPSENSTPPEPTATGATPVVLALGGPGCAKPCVPPLRVESVLWDATSLDPGLPREIAGEVVLSASQAIAIADTDDGSPFLVGGWYRTVVQSCPAPPPGDQPTSPFEPYCSPLHEIGEHPFPPTSSPLFPTAYPAFLETGPPPPPDGRAILRVHAHDPLAAQCAAADRDQCERMLVVDDVAWTDQSPAPSPSPSPSAGPSPSASPSGSPEPSASPSLPLGLPVDLVDGPVLTVPEALQRLASATDDARFFVMGGLESPPIPCPKPLIPAGPCNRFLVAQGGDFSGAGEALHLTFVSDLPSYLGDGAAIVRVHRHDPRVTPDEVVVDEIMWLLPNVALPHPTADAYQWDGLPVALGGEPILRPTAALALARQRPGSEPFLIGGWFGRKDRFSGKSDCAPTPPDLPLIIDDCMRPGNRFGWAVRQIADGPDAGGAWAVVGVPGLAIPDGRVVLRAHIHDPSSVSCPDAYRLACWDALVVDEVVWHEPAAVGEDFITVDGPRAAIDGFLEARARGEYRRAADFVATYIENADRYKYERSALAAARFQAAGAATGYVVAEADRSNISGAHMGAAYARLVAQGFDLSTAHLYVVKHPDVADRSLDPEEWIAGLRPFNGWTLYPITGPDLPELVAAPPP